MVPAICLLERRVASDFDSCIETLAAAGRQVCGGALPEPNPTAALQTLKALGPRPQRERKPPP